MINETSAQKTNFSHITYSEGLTNNRVLSFAQDDNGFIWIGTTTGLNRYDGYTIKTFSHNKDDSTSLPDNMVQAIVKDQLGQLWIKTPKGLVVFNPENELFTSSKVSKLGDLNIGSNDYISVYPLGDSLVIFLAPGIGIVEHNIYTNQNNLFIPKVDNKAISANLISSMFVEQDDLYVIYLDGVIDIFTYPERTILNRCEAINKIISTNDIGFNLFIDNVKNIWVYGVDDDLGLFCIDTNYQVKQFNTHTKSALNSNLISDIIQDEDGKIWVGTDHGGINIINTNNESISYILNDVANPHSLSQNVITCLFKSNENLIWVGTYKEGVNYFHKNMFKFLHFNHNSDKEGSLPYDDVNCYAEDNIGNLYIGTNGGGLLYYNRLIDTFSEVLVKELSHMVIVSLCYDSDNVLWIGTYYGGLLKYDGKNVVTYIHDPNRPESLSDDRIWDIFEDSNGNLWIGTLGGGLELYDKARNVFVHYGGDEVNTVASDFVMNIAEDHYGSLWFATNYGLYKLDKSSSRFIQYTNDINDENSLSDNFASTVFVDSKNNLWVGTRHGLNLFDRKLKNFIKFNTANGLPNNSVMSILESAEGDIWLSTTGGLCKLSLKYDNQAQYIKHYTTNFNESDGLQGREFNEGSAFNTSKGELVFGGSNGFNMFVPEKNIIDSVNLDVHIFGLEMFGREYEKREGRFGNQNDLAILNNNEIHLSYEENIFSLQFVAINFLNSHKIKYRYKLEGFNDQWIYTSWEERKATYTNLNPGKYNFIVQASYPNLEWEQPESTLQLVVHPPWYRTWLAYILYYVLLVIVIFISRRTVIVRERIKYQKEEAVKESERQQELNLLKTRFFTNVSHEFRTPLTLILTPLEKLLKGNIKDDTRKHLELMNQNAKRLFVLVNQLLDFRKAEENKLNLNLIYGNIIGFISTITNSFADYCETKNISLGIFPEEKELFMQFDKDKVEKIIMNLLSNAFKFTPEGGNIKVFIDTLYNNGVEYLKIKVEDNGIGISEHEKEKIFERFYQSNLPGEFITKGSGIGLSLTHDFVNLHGGSITVKSEVGKGSKFIVKLPINRNSSAEVEAFEIDEHQDNQEINGNLGQVDELHDGKSTILIVEDNIDFRFYLKDSLQAKYNILESANGKQALEFIATDKVDLVVSDVMMPEMDGFELCDTIKNNPDYSHTPVILLTAKSTQQDKLEGLKYGADDYITKPFNFEILEARVNYLLGLRKKFIQEYQQSFKVKVNDKRVTPIEKKLLDKAIALINSNISNSEFSVEGMSKELGMSRVYLYKKLTALTGKTPIELIRLVRLKRAAELLMQGELNVSEITYEVGFSDPKYFSKMFKNEFGELPSKYKDSQV